MGQPLIPPDHEPTEDPTEGEILFDLAANFDPDSAQNDVPSARDAVLLSIAASLIEIRKVFEIQNGILSELLVYLPKGR